MARPYQKHGLAALQRRLHVRGLASLDRRSATFRRAMEWRRELESELGDELTGTRRTILDLSTMRMILLDHGYRWLIEQLETKGALSLINTKRRSLYPLAQQLAQLSETQERSMERLGLDRQHRPTESEQAIVAAVRQDLRRSRKKPKPAGNVTESLRRRLLPRLRGVRRSLDVATTRIVRPGQEAPTTATTWGSPGAPLASRAPAMWGGGKRDS